MIKWHLFGSLSPRNPLNGAGLRFFPCPVHHAVWASRYAPFVPSIGSCAFICRCREQSQNSSLGWVGVARRNRQRLQIFYQSCPFATISAMLALLNNLYSYIAAFPISKQPDPNGEKSKFFCMLIHFIHQVEDPFSASKNLPHPLGTIISIC